MYQYQSIVILKAGDTPWAYSDNPGEVPGPWEGSPDDAIAEYKRQSGDDIEIEEYWERGESLWIAPRPFAEAEAARP